MEYDAITIDTCVFDRNGLRLEDKLLSQLTQFKKEGSAQFVMADIIFQELKRHLFEKTSNSKNSCEKTLKMIKDHSCLEEDSQKELIRILENGSPIGDLVKTRLERFKENTALEILDCKNYVEVNEVLGLYHECQAPFSEQKKSEFPDAFALLCLEKWANINGKKVLAVSTDKDWVEFAENSSRIDVINDLGLALENFHQGALEAKETADEFMKQLATGNKPSARNKIWNALENEISNLTVYIEADSAFTFEEDDVHLVLLEFNFLTDDFNDDRTHLTQEDESKIVFRTPINVDVKAFAIFHLSIRDSIDRDYVPMGSVSIEKEDEIQCELLLTLENTNGNFELTQYEILFEDKNPTIYFGLIEPDWRD